MKTALIVASSLAVVLALYLALAIPAAGAARGIPGQVYVQYSMAPQDGLNVVITSIQITPTTVTQGQIVNIGVEVENLEDTPETFEVILMEDTNGREIGSAMLTLEAGQGAIAGFQWETMLVPPGTYHPTASATAPDQRDTLYSSLTSPTPVTVGAAVITFDSLEPPQATFGRGMAQPAVDTLREALEQIILRGHHAHWNGALLGAGVTTPSTPANSIFVANAGATFQPAAAMRNPFLGGFLEGTLRLQSRESSLGAYVQVGGNTVFVDPDGGYRITAPSGLHDVLLESPGYVPARIVNASIEPGEVLVLPEVTLPFGDGNGDGKIDILDLAIAAGNFGKTPVELEAP